ncbi:hypothetical protein INT47_006997 [Mucor saturninus]|uniref:Uncharacterized protein n=1 Tax=Mucor saturninus TaxID=64648 RepID=A0A8H7QP38_9FUNG|nr:hypothetical protein INT47_006997 [Mucor saturninus]
MYNDYPQETSNDMEEYYYYEEEDSYFADYDREVANAVTEADYQDFGDGNAYDYRNDCLLELVVGVQSYLTEQQAVSSKIPDSPLYNLQYKLYSYMRQRALQLGAHF